MPSIEPYITPRDFRALPDEYLALYIALTEYVGWAYGAVHAEHCRPDLKPLFIAAAAASVEASWYVHMLPRPDGDQAALDRALTAIRAAHMIDLSDDVIAAAAAVRVLLGEPSVPAAT